MLKDKVTVITGASHGLGRALAVILAQKGAHVVVSARSGNELNALAKEINGTVIVADVTKESDIKNLMAKTIEKFGKIDIWVNNAGIWLPKAPVEEADMKAAHNMMEVNLFGTVYGSRESLVQMKKQGYGTILNIVSTSALSGRPMASLYSASKWAERGFTDSLREELKGTGVNIIGVYPGGIKTLLFDAEKPAEYADFMEPEYVATKIVENLEKNPPEPEQILKRPGQK